MSLYSLPSLSASLLLVFLFFYASRKASGAPQIHLLLCLIVSCTLYMVCEFFLINASAVATALLFDKFIYVGISVAIANYLHLAFVFPKPFKSIASHRYLLSAIYLPAAFFIFSLPTDQFIAGMKPEYWGWGKAEGPLYDYFRLYLVAYPLACLVLFAIKRRNADSKVRNGLFLFLLSCVGPGVLTVTVTLVLQPMGIHNLNIMLHAFSIVPALYILTYVISRQHLLYDMQLLLAPAIKTPKYHLHQKIKSLINEIHGHDFDYRRLVQMLHDTLRCAVGLEINGKPVASCGADDAFIRFKLEELDQQIAALHRKEDKRQQELLILSHATFDTFDAIHAQMEKCGIEAILPVYEGGQILGTLKFGRGFSEQIYSKQDFELISVLWTQLVVALKYIRKLEEQLALKDSLIEKLHHKIQIHEKPMNARLQPARVRTDRVLLVSQKEDLTLPLKNLKKVGSIADALKESPSADLFILDCRNGMRSGGAQLHDLDKPMIVIGSPKEVPSGPGDRLMDVVAPEAAELNLLPAVNRLLRLREATRFRVNGSAFITASPRLTGILARLEQTAAGSRSVLITGDTGTGKELIASYVGQICRKKIISVNCAAISAGLFESAFCGHEKGAFTGADQLHRGFLEQADKAVLFLDEVSELPLELQAKLLRIIEGAPFQRLGGRQFIQPDVQFVCASNRDLRQMVDSGRFREDLLYRLDQLSFVLPPLSQRREDIPLLSSYFLLRFKRRYQVEASIDDATMETFRSHSWPGNVRELSNAVLKWVMQTMDRQARDATAEKAKLPDKIKELEAALIQQSLRRHGSKSRAAQALGIPLSTLRSKLKKLDLSAAAGQARILHPTDGSDLLSINERLEQFESSIIGESLKSCESQSAAARDLGIPLSTLRSKLRKYKIDVRSEGC